MEVDAEVEDQMETDSNSLSARWSNYRKLLSTNGPLSNDQFEADPNGYDFLRENIKILVIGAGGLGCELLKDLALTGFKHIDVIDMDTIDLSNLNRQFLFRQKDIGKSKAVVAAEFINKRVKGCCVKPHYCKIQDFDEEFYRGFNFVVCGLDSVVARRWINGMLLSLLQYDDSGQLDQTSVVPWIDGGTEGFKGNARVIMPGLTACIECNLDLFPQQVNYPMCTIADTPRLPQHCIEYVKIIQWPKEKPFDGVNIDGDDPEHVKWIFEKASNRASLYGIEGVTYRLTKGVIKNIIPAVASTNAIIAAMCAAEVLKVTTFCYAPMNNYTIFNDAHGVYTYTFEAEKKDDCPACSSKPVDVSLKNDSTLEDLLQHLKDSPRLQLKSPGATTILDGKNKTLYIPNIPSLEEATRENLPKTLQELGLSNNQEITVTDVTSPKTLRIRLSYLNL